MYEKEAEEESRKIRDIITQQLPTTTFFVRLEKKKENKKLCTLKKNPIKKGEKCKKPCSPVFFFIFCRPVQMCHPSYDFIFHFFFSFSTLSSASTPSQFFFIKKKREKTKNGFFFFFIFFSSAKQLRMKKVKGRMRRSMVAMGGHLGNKKNLVYFFLEKGPKKKKNNFWTKARQNKEKITLPPLFSACLPTQYFFSSLISIHSFFIFRNESNLSMKNKFYIKGSQFFFILNSHSIFFLFFFFFALKSPPKKFSSFFIFSSFFFSFSFINE